MKKTLLILPLIFLLTCQLLVAQAFLLSNVNIVSMEDDSVVENQAILVADGKIFKIIPMSEDPSRFGRNVINGNGAYVYPGLAEFHSHIPVARDGDAQLQREAMMLYLANGVLRVRGMIGHRSHLALKKKVEANEFPGPRLFLSGPSFSESSVSSPEQAAQMVVSQQEAGFDHLKLHPGLELDEFLAIAKAAQENNMPFGGHVSLDVGLEKSIKNGYQSIEHMDGYVEALIPDYSKVLNPEKAGPFSMLLVEEADKNDLSSLIDLTLEYGVWIAPTLSLFDRFFGYKPAEEYRHTPEMNYMSAEQIQGWINAKTAFEQKGILTKKHVQPYLDFRNELFLALHQAGVPMLMSSDSPQVFNVPGFSIHHEIALMSQAGMSNYEILKTASVNPAKYFGKEEEWGMILEGMSADFVMVKNNPLVDLETLKYPELVVIRGKRFDKEAIRQELSKIEQRHQRK